MALRKASTAAAAIASLDGVGRCLGIQWREAALCHSRAATVLILAQPDVVTTSWDAGRFGKPAKDLLVILVGELRKHLYSVLPPAVNRIHTVII